MAKKWLPALLVSIALLTVATVFFLLGLGLAIAGINFAEVDDERYVEALINADDYYEDYWYFYMSAATVAMLPFGIFGALGFVLLITAIRHTKQHDERKRLVHTKSGHFELEGVDDSDIHEKNITGRIDTIKGVQLVHFTGAPLSPVTFGAVFSVFISIFLACSALLCILWGLAISYDNIRRTDKNIWPYIVVEALIGLVMPVLVIIATCVFGTFLEYITQGGVDARVLLTRLLPVVKLVQGEHYEYWSIMDRFYFQLSSHDSNYRSKKKQPLSCLNMCSRTPATWIITAIVALSFWLAVSYFINSNIAQQTTLKACPHPSQEIDCFNGTLGYIDCENQEFTVSNNTVLHCFRFLRFGKDSDIIGDLSRAFAFYLATIAFFTTAFQIANVLINFKPSRLWGILFVALGIIVFGVGLFVTFSGGLIELHLDVIQVFQIFMVSCHAFLTGLLLLISKWWEKVGNSHGAILISPGFKSNKKTFDDVKMKLNDETTHTQV